MLTLTKQSLLYLACPKANFLIHVKSDKRRHAFPPNCLTSYGALLVHFSCVREFMHALKDNVSLLDVDLTANLIGVAETIHVRGSAQISMADGGKWNL